jgi:hypothetical protein
MNQDQKRVLGRVLAVEETHSVLGARQTITTIVTQTNPNPVNGDLVYGNETAPTQDSTPQQESTPQQDSGTAADTGACNDFTSTAADCMTDPLPPR